MNKVEFYKSLFNLLHQWFPPRKRSNSLVETKSNFMGAEKRFAGKRLSKKKSSSLFWDKNGRIDTLKKLIPSKSNLIFCHLCSLFGECSEYRQ